MDKPRDLSAAGLRKRRSVDDKAGGDRALAQLAGSRDGIVTTAELLALGFSEGAIAHRARNGRLHRLYPGVYAVGHVAVSRRGRWRAAVVACGEGALLSHLSAAAHWGLSEDRRSVVDVTVPAGGRRRRGIVVHRGGTLRRQDRVRHQGLPVTGISRTLLDLAPVLSASDLERAVIEAERMRLLDSADLVSICGRGRRGATRLREIVVRELAPEAGTDSELERRFVSLCRRYSIPLPLTNVYVAGLKVDCFWPEQRLVVELDGHAFHRTPGDQRRDAARDRRLALAGCGVLRFGWADVTKEGPRTATTVLTMLRREPRVVSAA